MIIVVLADGCSEEDARVVMAVEHGHRNLPYRGVWVHPTPDHPLVHIFSTKSEQELEKAGWTRESG